MRKMVGTRDFKEVSQNCCVQISTYPQPFHSFIHDRHHHVGACHVNLVATMMVGLEGNRDKINGRLLGQTCANECSSELEQKEKEIERKLLIAEKDKREAMYSLDCIKSM